MSAANGVLSIEAWVVARIQSYLPLTLLSRYNAVDSCYSGHAESFIDYLWEDPSLELQYTTYQLGEYSGRSIEVWVVVSIKSYLLLYQCNVVDSRCRGHAESCTLSIRSTVVDQYRVPSVTLHCPTREDIDSLVGTGTSRRQKPRLARLNPKFAHVLQRVVSHLIDWSIS